MITIESLRSKLNLNCALNVMFELWQKNKQNRNGRTAGVLHCKLSLIEFLQITADKNLNSDLLLQLIENAIKS